MARRTTDPKDPKPVSPADPDPVPEVEDVVAEAGAGVEEAPVPEPEPEPVPDSWAPPAPPLMKFHTKGPGRVLLHPGVGFPVRKIITFHSGTYTTSDPDEIAALNNVAQRFHCIEEGRPTKAAKK